MCLIEKVSYYNIINAPAYTFQPDIPNAFIRIDTLVLNTEAICEEGQALKENTCSEYGAKVNRCLLVLLF